MLRSIKYGVFGAILAGLIAAPVAWASVDKSVSLAVDGKVQAIHTTAADVGQLLASRGYDVTTHDLVAPAPTAALHDGMHVVLRRGRLLHLRIDGTQRNVWTTAPTVALALAQLGYPSNDFVSVSRSQRLPLSPSTLTIRTPKSVTIIDHGSKRQLTTTDETVGQLLSDVGIAVGRHDEVQPSKTSTLTSDTLIRIQRVVHKTVVRREKIGFPTRRRNDANVLKGHSEVVQAGRAGIVKITYALVYLDGKEVGRTRVGSQVVRQPRTKIVGIGTKQPAPRQLAAAPQHNGGGGGGAPSAGIPSPGSAQATAREMLPNWGWGNQEQYSCLVTLWNHESSWRVNAYNPSGAYGIPQALPGSKMASAGADWRTDAATQIRWGLNYIHDRYGTPCGAWDQWQAHGGWY